MRPPNILITIADDQRGSALGFLGEEHVQTPALDQLAAQGACFRRARHFGSRYGAVCAPSRCMLHTGLPYFRIDQDFLGSTRPTHPHREADVPITMGARLRKLGYETFATGKWHNGVELFAQSFSSARQVFFGGMADHWFTPVHDHDPSGGYHGDDARRAQGFSTEVFARSAMDFLHSRRGNDQPFFCYVAFTAPHDPRTPPDAWRSRYAPADAIMPPNVSRHMPDAVWFENTRDEYLLGQPRNLDDLKRAQAEYFGMISHMDEWIGHIHEALTQSGHADNTLVIHTADHGLGVGQHGLLGKQNLFEHSWRVPLIIAGPNIPPGQVSDALVYQADLHPTLMQRVGADCPDTFRSLDPIMQGHEGRSTICGSFRDLVRCAADRQWKLICSRSGRRLLFDLTNDPWELQDRSGDPACAPVIARLEQAIRQWVVDHGDGDWKPGRQ